MHQTSIPTRHSPVNRWRYSPPFWVPVLLCVCQQVMGQLEPVRASYDVIPGQPLILSVRPEGGRRPKSSVILRFPDGREIEGDVAAVRLSRVESDVQSWLEPGVRWEVLGPREAGREFEKLAWFVLADLPVGVIGQEVWLDGQPVQLRWLPRPRLMAARLGFDPESGDAGPLSDPWTSPLPASWRKRPDLAHALKPAAEDPLRRWRARLATVGLHPESDRGVGPITPDLLGSGLVEASSRVAPLAERLLEAIAAQSEARWRIALAKLWAADPALSMRIRHTLAGAGSFPIEGHAGEHAIMPIWNARGRDADVLLEMLLSGTIDLAEQARRAEAWLTRLPDSALWVIDDGFRGGASQIGAMYLRAGDTTAIEFNKTSTLTRPRLLTTRHMSILRPARPVAETTGVKRFGVRLAGRERWLAIEPGPTPASPPGVRIGPVWADYSMEPWLASVEDVGAAALRDDNTSGLISRKPGGDGAGSGWRLFLRLDAVEQPSSDEVRIWIGPSARTKGILTLSADGRLDLQRFADAGVALGDPAMISAVREGDIARLEIALPEGSIEPDGTLHIGLERVDGRGNRWSWARPMLPWQIEPPRRVLDTTAWMGGLAP